MEGIPVYQGQGVQVAPGLVMRQQQLQPIEKAIFLGGCIHTHQGAFQL